MKKLDVKSIKDIPFNDNIQETASSQFKNSEKVYLSGSTKDIRVPMRKITQTSLKTSEGEEKQPQFLFTIPLVHIPIQKYLLILKRACLLQELG